jgi:hypothetical protein
MRHGSNGVIVDTSTPRPTELEIARRTFRKAAPMSSDVEEPAR